MQVIGGGWSVRGLTRSERVRVYRPRTTIFRATHMQYYFPGNAYYMTTHLAEAGICAGRYSVTSSLMNTTLLRLPIGRVVPVPGYCTRVAMFTCTILKILNQVSCSIQFSVIIAPDRLAYSTRISDSELHHACRHG